MMLTDFGEEMCWGRLSDVGDRFGHFGHQHPLSFYISTNIEVLSPTPMNRHQHHDIPKITISKISFAAFSVHGKTITGLNRPWLNRYIGPYNTDHIRWTIMGCTAIIVNE